MECINGEWNICGTDEDDSKCIHNVEEAIAFISAKWLATFANYRRDGYDFDARYEDGLASVKHKNIILHKILDYPSCYMDNID